MKKWLGGLLILVLMLCIGTVLAEGQTDPTRPQMLESLQIKQRLKEEYHNPGPNDTSKFIRPTITVSGSKLPGKTLTFKATGVPDGSFEYWWGITDEGRDPNGYIYYPNHDNLKDKKTIKYKFYSAGTYSVTLFLLQGGTTVGYSYVEFTVQGDGTHPTLEQKAQEIVNLCKGSDQWHTALNLYDWLTHHAYYDATYDTHGADLLFLGYGVCDSYSKAYALLCRTAGISVERCFGPNHAWNTLKLGGKWYQADPTWDDPGAANPGEGKPESGSEGHSFFCVSAAAMIPVSSHSYSDGTQEGNHAAQCTSMDANYYVHEKLWKGFGEWAWDSTSGGGTVNTYTSQIQQEFDSGNRFEKQINRYVYFLENGSLTYAYFEPSILREILKAGMPKQQYTLGGDKVSAKTSVSKNLVLSARITGWKIDETGILTVPGGITAVSSQVFYHHAATRVVLPKGCGKIGSKAFADSAVRVVEIPGPVTTIEDDAFSGCGKIMFISSDKAVKTFAAEHGFFAVDP